MSGSTRTVEVVVEEIVIGAERAVSAAEHGGAIGERGGRVDGPHTLRSGWRQGRWGCGLRGLTRGGLGGGRVLTSGTGGAIRQPEEGHRKRQIAWVWPRGRARERTQIMEAILIELGAGRRWEAAGSATLSSDRETL